MISYELERFGDTNYIEYSHHFNFSFPIHLHRCIEFTMVTEGKMDVIFKDKHFTLSAGKGALFLSNELHGFQSLNSSHMISLIFSPELVPSFANQVKGKTYVSPCFTVEPLLSEQLIPQFQGKHERDVLEIKGVLYLLCASFLRQVLLSNITRTTDMELLNKIFIYMNEHFTENLTLSSMAKDLGYDYYYLSRYFSKAVHSTFQNYLTQYRVSYAAELIERTTDKITNIAFLAGFSSIRTFNHAFYKIMSMTPRDFRQKCQKDFCIAALREM